MSDSAEGDHIWKCPDCPWWQRPHPTYGWGGVEDRTVWVHQNILCPNRATPPAGQAS